MEYRSALLASHGIASLALDYLTSKITTETGKMVDNQYFEVRIWSQCLFTDAASTEFCSVHSSPGRSRKLCLTKKVCLILVYHDVHPG